MAKPALCLTFFALAYLCPLPFPLSLSLLCHLSPTLASIILVFFVVGFFLQLVFVNFLVEHNLSVCRTNDLRCMLNEVWAQRAGVGGVGGGGGVGAIVLRMKSWAWRGRPCQKRFERDLADGGDCRECNLNICICFGNGNSWHV